MYDHQRQTIARVTDYFAAQPGVRALLLGGSIAHGFAQASSDVDIMIVVAPEEFQRRAEQGELAFFSRELCTYPEGYVDGKYISEAFLNQVAERGSEPARFAFKDSQILFSQIADLAQQIERIARYPVEEKFERICRFNAQFEAWHWYMEEGEKKANDYLKGIASHKLILFGSRMILAHNELLYPYHKWLLAVLARAADQPAGLAEAIQTFSRQPTLAHANSFYQLIKGFRTWESDPIPWPNRFMRDSELNWLYGPTPVDDL